MDRKFHTKRKLCSTIRAVTFPYHMGKKLDALLGRNFKASKFTATVNLALSRLAILKNKRHAHLKLARSDVHQLLQLGHHDRALLRAEHVIKEQNMLDVYDKIEGYCNLLFERVHLIAQERECPEELKEAASGLLYMASRCGDLPEILEIRAMLTSRFGKEFAARAVELRNNCGVDPQLIQKLSTRMPSLESRTKVLKDIASENNIILLIEEVSSVTIEEQVNVAKQNQQETRLKEENLHNLLSKEKDEESIDSFKAMKKYKDVADAAKAAFESAAQAAAAARAALELSQSSPHGPDDDHNSPSPGPRKFLDEQDSDFVEVVPRLEDSADEIPKGESVSLVAETEADSLVKELEFDESDDEADNKDKSNQTSKQTPRVSNDVPESKMHSKPHLDLEKRPFSVRTRHGY
ncbi:hypothetical protein HN51_056689 [Arachis hypogaea]|uniref:uncharacterized protein n=1 Tax=Arachis hypogaea TaxID=3818 RepID=UPI000A2AFCE2|nr:uncharacterized protein LOC107616180 isoform X1 [Arachis ipaensis]XP_025677439.1 uncharacterized protein LOC112777311 isoform X2 [Arachis hypogaea]